jgi:hypothetical protein
MVKRNKVIPALGAAVVLLALSAIATPGFAQQGDQAGDARTRALEECSRAASKYKNYSWGSQEITAYRACMGERGQAE